MNYSAYYSAYVKPLQTQLPRIHEGEVLIDDFSRGRYGGDDTIVVADGTWCGQPIMALAVRDALLVACVLVDALEDKPMKKIA